MMDVGGKVPGSQVSDATSSGKEGLRIPPVKIIEGGTINETALAIILNNTRTPDTNRSDLMALIGGCRAAERRVLEICERFGDETFDAACDALLETARASRWRASFGNTCRGACQLQRTGSTTMASGTAVQDGAHDLAGRGRLSRGRTGNRPAGSRVDQLPHP